MIGYKLFHLRKDGTLGPLFINKKQRIKIGQLYKAENHPTKGYKVRPGWHICEQPVAPHLKQRKDRVWAKIRFADFTIEQRPKHQGGKWFIAKNMVVLEIL